MRIRVDCEESQTLTIELRKKGHEAFSCDILPCSGGHKEWHIQGSCFDQDNSQFDLILSFPPCTDIALSGAKHFEKKRNDGRQRESIIFFFKVWLYSDMCENPMGILNGGGGYIKKWFPDLYKEMILAGFPFKPTQIIQPWQFGDTYQKTTCLWLKKTLKPLYHLAAPDLFDDRVTHVGKGEFIEWVDKKTGKISKQPKWYVDAFLNGGEDRAKIRSKTFPGIAKAMAEQWT